MEAYEVGSLVKSKAGHDKDQIYVIIKADDEYIYLSDGIYKTLDKLKKKKRKHIQRINYVDDVLSKKIKNHEKIINEEIKRTIKLYVNRFQASK